MSNLRAFTMPKWGIEMVEGIVADWQINDGDAFAKGDVLVGIETDKIVNEVAAEYDAVCLRRLAEEGDTLAVGELLAVFGDADASTEDVEAFIHDFVPAGASAEAADADPAPDVSTTSAPPPHNAQPVVVPEGVSASSAAVAIAGELGVSLAQIQGCGRDGRIQRQDVQRAAMPDYAAPGQPLSNAVDLAPSPGPATDIARRLAKRDAVDLADIQGSGADGRIRSRDLTGAGETPTSVDQAPAPGAGRSEPFSNMRKQIARRLTSSYQNIPHYNVQIDVFVDALLAARKTFNAVGARKTSINDWLLRAVALSLIEHPDVNINVHDERITYFEDANLAIAVAIDGGLITPVLQRAQNLPVDQISASVADLAQRARAGQLVQEDMSGGSFTISNLGMFGVSRFTAIINPPQGAILAIGAARSVPTERDGRVAFGQQMTLTLGCDHRAIDGAMAGRFLATLRDRLENPETLLG